MEQMEQIESVPDSVAKSRLRFKLSLHTLDLCESCIALFASSVALTRVP